MIDFFYQDIFIIRQRKEVNMILKSRKKFDKYIVGRRRESCGYREVYDARYNDTQVVLTVYDVEKTPSALLTDLIVSADLKLLPRESWVLSQVTGEQFPHMIEAGSTTIDGREIAFFVQEYFNSGTLAEMTSYGIAPEWRIVQEMEVIIKAVQELAKVCDGGHFNLSPQTIMEIGDGHGNPIIRIAGLDHAGGCCNGNPWFDTNTLNHCCRPPESFLGLFDRTTDVYALGMLMAYMFTGKYPYPIDESMSPQEIRNTVKKSKPSFDQIPRRFQPFIGRAVEHRATLRFRDVDEFAKEFYKIIGKNQEKSPHTISQSEKHKRADDVQPQTAQSAALKVDIGVRQGKGFSAVAGMETLKDSLKTDFVDIVKHRELAQILGIEPPNMILYGPPGNGKTYIIERLAEECGMEYCYVRPSSIGSIYIHGSQTMIADLFTQAEEKAKKNPKGCLLMIDEIDAVCPSRIEDDNNHQAGEVAEFLTQLYNCVEKKVYVVGTTNRISKVDKAILRAGRIDQVIYIGLPDDKCRRELFDYELGKRPHSTDIDTTALARQTEGYTAADIAKIVKLSSRHIFRACLENRILKPEITQECIEQTIKECRPSVNSNEITEYERQRDEFITGGMVVRKKIGF